MPDRSLFWAIEFVADKVTKVLLDPTLKLRTDSLRLHDKGMKSGYDISIFHGTESADGGWTGDYIVLTPLCMADRLDVDRSVT